MEVLQAKQLQIQQQFPPSGSIREKKTNQKPEKLQTYLVQNQYSRDIPVQIIILGQFGNNWNILTY